MDSSQHITITGGRAEIQDSIDWEKIQNLNLYSKTGSGCAQEGRNCGKQTDVENAKQKSMKQSKRSKRRSAADMEKQAVLERLTNPSLKAIRQVGDRQLTLYLHCGA